MAKTDLAALRGMLEPIGQGHVLRFWDELDDAGRRRLAGQIEALNLEEVAELVETHVKQRREAQLPAKIDPPVVLPRAADAGREEMYAKALKRGQALLEAGQIGAFLVAGGQGTRLGYDGPKGEFPVTPVREKPLFAVFAEQLLAASKRYGGRSGAAIPWYIMTSELNDAPTRGFFERHACFGYPKQDVFFFQQGMMPAFAFDGRMLLAQRDSLALSPDGHGGSLRALARSGALADMKRRGIRHLSYFQVDNPIVQAIDPLFIGLHDVHASEMSSKTIPKSGPKEKLGNFGIVDGRLIVIEYSDLPDELAERRNERGDLLFNWGSIAIHALDVAFIDRLNRGGKLELPWHRAEKKVPHVDDSGREVEPQKPNAVKLEQFVFDAIPLARNPIVYETDRAEEFSPVKNAEGIDSPATSRRDQVRRAARWLAAAGVEVPYGEDGEPDALVEISPLFADTAEALKAKNLPANRIQAGERVYYGE